MKKLYVGGVLATVSGATFAVDVVYPTLDLGGVQTGALAVAGVLMAASGVFWGIRKILSLI